MKLNNNNNDADTICLIFILKSKCLNDKKENHSVRALEDLIKLAKFCLISQIKLLINLVSFI